MHHTPRRLATTVVAALAVLALGAAPALAESQSHQDPRGDVKSFTLEKGKPKPGIDIVRLENTFKGSSLDLSMSTVKLRKRGYGAAWIIKADGVTYELLYDYTGDEPVVSFFSATSRAGATRGLLRGTPDPCPGAKAKVKGDDVVGSVPRSCLGGAARVRVASIIVQQNGMASDHFKVDDGWQKGFDLQDGPKYGPALDHN